MSFTKKKFTQFITGYFRNSFMKDIKETYYDQFLSGKSSKYVLFYILLGGFILLFFPLLFTKINLIDFGQDKPGEIGDIINGVTAPFIGFGAIIVTFYAFWIQFKANIALKKDIELERFENKYYELLRLHRANVQEMDIAGKYKGRNCFTQMYKEFKFIYRCVEKYFNELQPTHSLPVRNVEELTNIAFKLFFYGIGYESDKTIDYLINIKDRPFIQPVISELKSIQSSFEIWDINHTPNIKYFNTRIDYNGVEYDFETDFFPFDGHATRLSHYFRHLFQAVKFIDDNINLNENQKKNYLRTIRAQLSNYEQLLLYYNSISSFGSAWLKDKNYLVTYGLIHNIPIPLADIGIRPKIKFQKEVENWSKRTDGKRFFEWDEFSLLK